jgi:hypothetical protein
MNANIIAIVITFLIPMLLVVWNKMRVRGKMLCYFARKDKSLKPQLCTLKASFIIFEDRAYDIYPDYVRLTRFPSGWPPMFQELVPCGLWDEEDALQKDWISLAPPREGSLSLRAALDENWIKKLVSEASADGSGSKFNWKKILPIALLVLGAGGLVVILSMRGCKATPAAAPATGSAVLDLMLMIL